MEQRKQAHPIRLIEMHFVCTCHQNQTIVLFSLALSLRFSHSSKFVYFHVIWNSFDSAWVAIFRNFVSQFTIRLVRLSSTNALVYNFQNVNWSIRWLGFISSVMYSKSACTWILNCLRCYRNRNNTYRLIEWSNGA